MHRLTPILPLLLAACGYFPAVNAAAPAELGPLPKYMTPAELEQVTAFDKAVPPPVTDDLGQDLRAKAEALRSR